MTTGKTIALTRWTFVGKVMFLLLNMQKHYRLVIAFLPRSKCLNFMAAITIYSDFGAQKNKVSHCFHCFPIYLLELFKLMSTESMMPSNHLILCYHPFLLPSIFLNIRGVFSSELALQIRWPKYWSFSISHSNKYLGLISLEFTGLILLSMGFSSLL